MEEVGKLRIDQLEGVDTWDWSISHIHPGRIYHDGPETNHHDDYGGAVDDETWIPTIESEREEPRCPHFAAGLDEAGELERQGVPVEDLHAFEQKAETKAEALVSLNEKPHPGDQEGPTVARSRMRGSRIVGGPGRRNEKESAPLLGLTRSSGSGRLDGLRLRHTGADGVVEMFEDKYHASGAHSSHLHLPGG